MSRLKDWIDGLGYCGPLALGVIYVVATICFIPGTILTLAAGALFGLWVDLAVVSVASTTSDHIVGATIVAENAGDLISEVTVAMKHGLGLGKLASSILPYPTRAEAIRKLGDQFNYRSSEEGAEDTTLHLDYE